MAKATHKNPSLPQRPRITLADPHAIKIVQEHYRKQAPDLTDPRIVAVLIQRCYDLGIKVFDDPPTGK